tara:strand:- start:14 stop:181 length:168 start_codon:yes stop_codon:yes gene_type:complete
MAGAPSIVCDPEGLRITELAEEACPDSSFTIKVCPAEKSVALNKILVGTDDTPII